MIDALMRWGVKFLLWLRYRIRIKGLETIRAKGRRGILFLPNHPGLIDPIIIGAVLHKDFAPRFLADQDQVNRPVIRAIAKRIGVRTIPDLAKYGTGGRERIEAMLSDSIEGLKASENLVLYPAGHTYRQYLEDLRGNSGVETILRQAPDIRVVLVRTRGVWGSGFTWASGEEPSVARTLKKGALSLLLSGLFFAPRREVNIELVEPDDLPRDADRDTLNSYLEAFYNDGAMHNTYVPYTPWERGGVREAPEPAPLRIEGSIEDVPPATREIVIRYLGELSGRSELADEDHLARDLGLDSLARAELVVWLEGEFGFPGGDVESLQTVSDVLLAACGQAIVSGPKSLKPIPSAWFADRGDTPLGPIPEGDTIAEVFLAQASKQPGRVIIADQGSGVRTYRGIITAVMLLRKRIEKLPGENIGIMLPAGVAADVVFLATMFSGKTPVMVNWTGGSRNMQHSLDLVGVECVLTSELLVNRLASQGIAFDAIEPRFTYLETLGKSMGRFEKLAAFIRSRLTWSSLRNASILDSAVILFTSGSESLPKAVPLTHRNILANVRDVAGFISLRRNDRLIGILPPFHSFGLTVTIVFPLCVGLPVVYHPNPTESPMLARLIEAYRCTLLMGTPTFLNGIVRASTEEQLGALRLAVTGAEKCPERVYQALSQRCPQLTILEGYGITECSPIVSVNEQQSPKPYTIGKVLPSLEHVIVDVESGQEAPVGQTGLLLVRGPSVFGGYIHYDGPSPFVEFSGKTWYRTGDLVCEDSDGVLAFAGRLKRFVKLGGEMISLPAIEAVLEQHFVHAEGEGPVIAVEATPSEEHPEIVLFTCVEADRETVNRHIRDAGLSPLHNIRQIIPVPEIPLLGTGKTDYRTLKKVLSQSRK